MTKAWEDLVGKNRGFGLTGARLHGKGPFEDHDPAFSNGMTIVCGLNGVGKTTLLRLIEAALAGSDHVVGRCRDELLHEGTFELGVVRNSTAEFRTIEQAASGVNVRVLDAFQLCRSSLALLQQDNFADLLEGVEPRFMTEDELSRLNYLLGRRYDEIRVYELESLEEADEPTPYFEVEFGGVSYSSSAMGMGELAALLLLWHLDQADPQTILLLEEPETFLSSRSVAALLNILAATIHERNLYAVVSTHSPEVVVQCPLDLVHIITPGVDRTSVSLVRPTSRADLEHRLSLVVGQARLVLVEDKMAAIVTSDLLGRFGGLWGQTVEIKGTGGEANLRMLALRLPKARNIRMVGVLDGDQEITGAETNWPLVLLPSTDSPDRFLRNAATSDVARFGSFLDRPTEAIAAALAGVEHCDDHDWFPDLAASLMIEESVVARAAVSCWLLDDENAHAAEQFVQSVLNAIST